MLESAANSMQEGKIDYFFISTHSERLHTSCIDFLSSFGYVILGEHSPEESFSVDGLIVAKRAVLPGCGEIVMSKRRDPALR
jgi:hypothetical protein